MLAHAQRAGTKNQLIEEPVPDVRIHYTPGNMT